MKQEGDKQLNILNWDITSVKLAYRIMIVLNTANIYTKMQVICSTNVKLRSAVAEISWKDKPNFKRNWSILVELSSNRLVHYVRKF